MELNQIQHKKLITGIVTEISTVPQEYLQTLYAIIHSFRTNLPIKNVDKITKKTLINKTILEEADFDWDNLLNEISENRKISNKKIFNRMTNLVSE